MKGVIWHARNGQSVNKKDVDEGHGMTDEVDFTDMAVYVKMSEHCCSRLMAMMMDECCKRVEN